MVKVSTLIFAKKHLLALKAECCFSELTLFLKICIFFSWNVLWFGGNGLTLFLAVLPCVFLIDCDGEIWGSCDV